MKENNILTYWPYDENSAPFEKLLNELCVKKCFCFSEEARKVSKNPKIEYIYFFESLEYYVKAPICHELDEDILYRIRPFMNNCLKIVNRWRRSYITNDSFRGVEDVFFVLLRFWNNFIIDNNISLLLISTIPHVPNEYIPYAICRAYGIPTIIQGGIPFIKGEKTNYILRPNAEEFDTFFNKRFKENQNKGISKTDLPRYMSLYLDQYSSRIGQVSANKKVVFYNEKNSLTDIVNKYKAAILKYLHRRDYGILIKKTFYQVKLKFETRALLNRISSFEEEPDLKEKYLFFALHLQPESTTLPGGGDFENQLLAIYLLSKHLPPNIVLYVKEHPAYWMQKGRMESIKESRSTDFYRRIVALPNVKLISHTTESSILIEKCLGVVTVTGTVGFEAIFKGKPVIAFGSVFYEDYPGVFRVKTAEDCTKAINEILRNKYPYHEQTMLSFLYALKKYVVPMGMFEKNFLDNNVPMVDNEDRQLLVEKIISFYREYYA